MFRERRHELRISPKGSATIRANTFVIRARLENMSRGGLSAITRTTAPDRLLGATVAVTIRTDSGESRWVEVTGRILRIHPTSVAIGFDPIPRPFQLVMDEMLSAADRNDRVLSLVLVDATEQRRAEMTAAFRSVGCEVIDVATPLEAIVRLGESAFEPDLIAIADSSPHAVSDELRRFVAADHPETTLVAIGDVESPDRVVRHWLSALDPAADLAARIRALLVRINQR